MARGGLELHTSPGDHDSLITEPHVGTLAALLDGCLARAAAAVTAAP